MIGVVTTILAWRVFLPLSRLVYCSMLLYILLMFVRIYGLLDLIYVNQFNIVCSNPFLLSHIFVNENH